MHITLATALIWTTLGLCSPVELLTGVTVDLEKRYNITGPDGVAHVDRLNSELARIQYKYASSLKAFEKNTGKPHKFAESFFKSFQKRSGTNPLTDYQENLWYGQVSVGTPAKSYTVDFDTGSADFFLPSTSCSNCGNHKKYSVTSTGKIVPDPAGSKSGKPFSESYGDLSTTSGVQYTDTVTIAGLTVKNQPFGVATSYSSSFASKPNDGLMGFGYPSLSNFPANSFIFNLKNGKIATAFSFKLAATGSQLYIGGADPARYTGQFYWTNLISLSFWEIKATMRLGDTAVASNQAAIVDSGTTLLYVDSATANAIYSSIKGAKLLPNAEANGDHLYSYPCASTIPNIYVIIGTGRVKITSGSFNMGTISKGSSQCLGGIAVGSGSFWILGDVFMRNTYTQFDIANNRLGVANVV